jgi:hypothetical protein
VRLLSLNRGSDQGNNYIREENRSDQASPVDQPDLPDIKGIVLRTRIAGWWPPVETVIHKADAHLRIIQHTAIAVAHANRVPQFVTERPTNLIVDLVAGVRTWRLRIDCLPFDRIREVIVRHRIDHRAQWYGACDSCVVYVVASLGDDLNTSAATIAEADHCANADRGSATLNFEIDAITRNGVIGMTRPLGRGKTFAF